MIIFGESLNFTVIVISHNYAFADEFGGKVKNP